MPAPQDYELLIRLQIASVEVPVGTVSASENLWSYVDEEVLGPERLLAFGLNGMRAGVAGRAHWPDLARMLQRRTGRQFQEGARVVIPGRPVHVTLKQDQAEQTLFVFHPDRTLTGLDFPAGDAIFSLVMTLQGDRLNRVLLTAQPQVRASDRKPRLVRESGVALLSPETKLHPLGPMLFQTWVESGDVLVIGPGSASQRAHSPGRHFLVRNKKGIEFETVLVLIPEVFRSPSSSEDKRVAGTRRQ
ncbi:MAG: hypothetical protein ACOC93_02625 [Planctomycetota bacterium]